MAPTRFASIVLLILLMVCWPGFRQGTANADELIIGTSTGYPPYYFEENGTLKGLCVDIINATGKKLNISVRYIQYPWKRMLHSGRTGSVDAVMPLFRTPERETFLYFYKNELAVEENRFFVKKDRDIHYTGDLKKLQTYSIGVVDNYSYGPVFDAAAFLNRIQLKNDQSLLEMLIRDRLDMGLGNPDVISFYAARNGSVNSIRFLDPAVTATPLYIGFSKARKTRAMAMAFSETLAIFKQSSAYTTLLNQYLMSKRDD